MVDFATLRLVDEEFRAIVRDAFDEVTWKVSFVTDRIERLWNIQKLS
jgi:hypothetical protein